MVAMRTEGRLQIEVSSLSQALLHKLASEAGMSEEAFASKIIEDALVAYQSAPEPEPPSPAQHLHNLALGIKNLEEVRRQALAGFTAIGIQTDREDFAVFVERLCDPEDGVAIAEAVLEAAQKPKTKPMSLNEAVRSVFLQNGNLPLSTRDVVTEVQRFMPKALGHSITAECTYMRKAGDLVVRQHRGRTLGLLQSLAVSEEEGARASEAQSEDDEESREEPAQQDLFMEPAFKEVWFLFDLPNNRIAFVRTATPEECDRLLKLSNELKGGTMGVRVIRGPKGTLIRTLEMVGRFEQQLTALGLKSAVGTIFRLTLDAIKEINTLLRDVGDTPIPLPEEKLDILEEAKRIFTPSNVGLGKYGSGHG